MRARGQRLGLAAAIYLIPLGVLWAKALGAEQVASLAPSMPGVLELAGGTMPLAMLPVLGALLGVVSMREARCKGRALSAACKAAAVAAIALLLLP